MQDLRAVLIGFGGMGRQDAALVYSGSLKGIKLCAICCRNKEGQDEIACKYKGVKIYENADAMFKDENSFNVLIIVTPHKTHASLALKALHLGKHVLNDKPIGISPSQAREIVTLAKEKNLVCATIFNMRAYPSWQKAKEFLKLGKLGKLQRVIWVVNSWYRSPAYHSSSNWRSSWNGEGGGLLINQCQHSLDIWLYLFGMPSQVYASIDYGKYNNFLVDDAVDIQMKYTSGLRGTFIASSGESPGVNRLEIWGSKGRLCIEDNLKLTFYENTIDLDNFAKENKEIYAIPSYSKHQIEVKEDYSDSYKILFQNFVNHIRKKEPLLATGDDGLNTLLLSSAAYLSSFRNEIINMPFDDDIYDAFLDFKMKSER